MAMVNTVQSGVRAVGMWIIFRLHDRVRFLDGRYLSTPYCPDQLWGPPSLFTGYRFFTQAFKRPGLKADHSPPSSLLYASFLLNLFFDPADGGDMFLRNIGWLSTDYTALYPRRYNHRYDNLRFYIVMFIVWTAWGHNLSVTPLSMLINFWVPQKPEISFCIICWISRPKWMYS
jgi:hypothetical protein